MHKLKFPLPQGSFIVHTFESRGELFSSEFRLKAWQTFDEFAEEADFELHDNDTVGFIWVNPAEGRSVDVTEKIAEGWLWYIHRQGLTEHYIERGFPAWLEATNAFENEWPVILEEYEKPEPYETERLRKNQLL